MTDSCGVSVTTLWEFVDGELDDARAQALRAHTRECNTCAEHLARIERLDAGLAAFADDEQAPDPDSIDGYRVVRRIGAGGMGVVYEARQPNPDRPVAIKVMRRSDPTRRATRALSVARSRRSDD